MVMRYLRLQQVTVCCLSTLFVTIWVHAQPLTTPLAPFYLTSINTHKICVENFWGKETTEATDLFKASYVSELVTATYSIASTSYFELQTYAGMHIDPSSYGYLYGFMSSLRPQLQQQPWINFSMGRILIRGISRLIIQTYLNLYQNRVFSMKAGCIFIAGNPLNPLVLKQNRFFRAMKWYDANVDIKSERERIILGRTFALLAGNDLLEQDQVGFGIALEFFCS